MDDKSKKPTTPNTSMTGEKQTTGEPISKPMGQQRPVDQNKNLGVRDGNEGEGNKTADKHYRDAATDFAQRTDTVQQATQAERDVEKNPSEYAKAEQAGKARGKGDLPADLKK